MVQSLCRVKKLVITSNDLSLHFDPLGRPGQAKIQMPTAICSIVKLIPGNLVNLSHLYKYLNTYKTGQFSLVETLVKGFTLQQTVI